MLKPFLLNLFKNGAYLNIVKTNKLGISFVNLHNKSPRKVNFLNLLPHFKIMKKVIIIAGITSLIFSACSNLKRTTYSDDVYVDPKEEKLEKERLAAEAKKQQEAAEKKRQEELAEQKAKDDANPAYKDPVYDKDDYYDYKYASRLRRFNNPVNGLGYYDDYYTNYYWYNGNPAYYGTSIYTSYNWWGPSYGYGSFGPSWGFGVGYNWGYPYGYGYDPYGYNAYWNGYYNGLYSGLYGYPHYGYNPYCGWGYYNSFDSNSGYYKTTYAPRTSHGGSNSGRMSNPGMNSAKDLSGKYIQSIKTQNESAPKFYEVSRPVRVNKNADNYGGGVSPSAPEVKPSEPRTNPYYNNPTKTNPKSEINNSGGTDINIGNPQPVKPSPVKQAPQNEPVKPIKSEYPKGKIFESGGSPNFNGGQSNPAPSGGSTPRSSGSGGTSRPR